jgi:hypothetical protein
MAWLVRLAAIGLLTASLDAGAQSADDRELMQFRLTPELLTQVEAVATAFDANIARDPAMKRKLDAQREIAVLEKKDDLTEAEQKRLEDLQAAAGDGIDLGINGGSLTAMSAQLSKVPAMAAALKSAGLAPRDMAKFIVTAVQTAMIVGLQQQGLPVPPGAAGENVRFVMANQASIERINKLLGAR